MTTRFDALRQHRAATAGVTIAELFASESLLP